MLSERTWPNYRGSEQDGVKILVNDFKLSNDVTFGNFNFHYFLKRGTELLPGLIFSKINFFVFRDMVKSLEYDVFTIIISNFD